MEQINTANIKTTYPSDTTTTTNIYSNNYCCHRLPCGMCTLTHMTCLKPINNYSFDKIYCGGNSSLNVTSTNDCT